MAHQYTTYRYLFTVIYSTLASHLPHAPTTTRPWHLYSPETSARERETKRGGGRERGKERERERLYRKQAQRWA